MILFPAVFIAIAFLIALVPLAMIVKTVNRLYWISKALKGGHRAEGRCLRIHTTHSTHHHDGHASRSSRRTYIFEFTAEDGRQIRFEDEAAPSTTVEGDYVTVAYVPERPEKATVVRDGDKAPYVQAGMTLLVLAVFLLVAVALGVEGYDFATEFGSDMSTF